VSAQDELPAHAKQPAAYVTKITADMASIQQKTYPLKSFSEPEIRFCRSQ
jgi:hypothetical protein